MPRITSVKVGGFKALTQVEDIKIGDLTIIAGANSSGKSSAMQPILLLKQSIEAPRGGTDLVLSGDHLKFTDKKQIQSRNCEYGKAKPCDLTIGVTVNDMDSMYQTYGASNGKPLSVVSAHYCLPRFGSEDFALKAGMTAEQVQEALRNFLRIINPVYEAVDYKVRVDRGLLSVALDLSRKDAEDHPDQLPLFALEVPFGDTFTSAVQGIIHVQGVRGVQRQSPFTPRRGVSFSGAMDLYVASLLLEWQVFENPKIVTLRDQLVRLRLTSGIEVYQINDSVVEVSVARSMSHPSEMVSIADVGFGVSQVLPVLLALLVAEENQLVYIEQPEVHLHPNAQVILAQIICETVRRKVRVVVETHSELMLLSIQTAVANGTLKNYEVQMHWFSRNDDTGATSISSQQLAEDGALGEWPSDFSSVTLDAPTRLFAQCKRAGDALPLTLIVDACIARSVGTDDGIAMLCGEILRAIKDDSSLGVHMCPTMQDEWFRHMNPASRTWFFDMVQKRRLFRAPVPEREDVRNAVGELPEGHNHKQLMEKDLHLVEAAFAIDSRILSADGKARNGFHKLSAKCQELKALYWAHVDGNACSKAAIEWVRLNAPHNESLMLAYGTL